MGGQENFKKFIHQQMSNRQEVSSTVTFEIIYKAVKQKPNIPASHIWAYILFFGHCFCKSSLEPSHQSIVPFSIPVSIFLSHISAVDFTVCDKSFCFWHPTLMAGDLQNQ